ncbi:MAG: PAS domain S-box protein [candidate division Zixibacteria bacterium]|nr:PAS domain S-box protein [candidate division Zixibacteria bacterium]
MSDEHEPDSGRRDVDEQPQAYLLELAEARAEAETARHALRNAESYRRLMVDLIGDLYLMCDLSGAILEVNDHTCQALGYTREELKTLRTADLDPRWNQEFLDSMQSTRSSGVPVVRYANPRRKSGTTFPVEVRVGFAEINGQPCALTFARDITHQTAAEAAIRERDERLRQLAENVDTVFWVIDWIEQRVVYVSPAYERIFGRSMSGLYDYPLDWLEAVHPKDREETEDAYYPAAVSGYDVTFRVIHPGGSIRWLHGRGFPIRDEHGRVYRLAGITEDVTDQRTAEQALRDSERRFRTLASLAPVGIFELDPKGSCLYVNERWCQMTGLRADEVSGSNLTAVIHPEDQERITAEWREALETKGEYSGEFRFKTPTGQVTWMFAVSLALKGDDGQISGYLGTITDITKLKDAEAALRASELRYRHLYDYSPAMYFTIDADGTVLSVNQVGAQQLGYTVDELLGQPVLSVFHEDDRDEVQRQMSQCASRPDQMFRWEFRKRKKDGTIIWVEEAARAVDNPDGTRVILILCEDVTTRKGL